MKSLKDINLRLKMKTSREHLITNPIIDQIWVKRKGKGEYFTEAPTLNRYRSQWPRNKCPHCGGLYTKDDIKSEDTVSWIFECPKCGVKLEVYRD